MFAICCLFLSAPFGWAAEKVKVALVLSKTGTAAIGNIITVKGLRFAVAELNQKGGVLGKQVQLIEFDNHSTALHSKRAAEMAVAEGVTMVFGANWSSHSLAMAPVLQAARIPMISTFSTNPDVTLVGDYIFRICFIDSFQGRIMAGFATDDLRAKSAAILANASSRYSEGLANYFHRHFVAQGGNILMTADYLKETEDFRPLLRKMTALNPDVLFIPGNILDSGLIIKQARNIGFSNPILGGDGWGDKMHRHAGSSLRGTFFSGHWNEHNKNPRSQQFVKGYEARYGKGEKDGAALAHDAVFLFADAVRRAGSLDRSKIRDALASTKDFQGVTGKISFNENGDPIKSGVVFKFNQGVSTFVKTVMP